MSNDRFDKSLAIAAFRGIARQLFENSLITIDEYAKIGKKLQKQENVLIGEGISNRTSDEKKTHLRQLSEKGQGQKGLDSFAVQSND